MDNGLATAIKAAGGFRSLARKIGVTHAAIRQWDRVPYVWLITIEKATGVPREKLRPELYKDFKRVRALEPA